MYLILIFTFVFFAAFVRRGKVHDTLLQYVYFIFLWLFAATSMNGKDRLSYEGIFNSIEPSHTLSLILKQNVIEKGYYLLNYLVRNFTDSFVIFLLISSFITSVLTFKALRYYQEKYNLRIELILLVYLPVIYLSAQMGALRQALAISIFIISFRYILEERYILYVIYILLASLFHISALTMLILPIVYYFKGKNRLIVIILLHAIIYYLLSIFSSIIEFGRLSNYEKEATSFGLLGSLERMLFFCLVILRYRMKKVSEYEKKLLELYVLYVCQVIVFDSFFSIMYRVKLYYFAIFAVLFPLLLSNITFNGVVLRRYILYFYGIVSGVIFTSSQEVHDYFFPYRNYLFNKHTSDEIAIIDDVEYKYKYIFSLIK